ncbi:MAG: hypothetical protein WCG01_04810 [bacterium]
MKSLTTMATFITVLLVTNFAFALQPPKSLGVFSANSATEQIYMDNFKLDSNWYVTGTINLKTNKNLAGLQLAIVTENQKIHVLELFASTKTNSLKGLTASNVSANAIAQSLSDKNPRKNYLKDRVVNNYNIASVAMIDLVEKTGIISVCDIKFYIEPGSSKFYIFVLDDINYKGEKLGIETRMMEMSISR